jgi:hypothetical protein
VPNQHKWIRKGLSHQEASRKNKKEEEEKGTKDKGMQLCHIFMSIK